MRNWRVFLTATCVATCAASAAFAGTYLVKVENMIPGGPATGQPATPPLAVVHDAGYSLFGPGQMATAGLELLAEEGNPADLKAEADASGNVSFSTVGAAGPFFDEVEFMVTGNPGELLSVVFMLARSNDLISGIHDVPLPADSSMTMLADLTVYDAGTEENTGQIAHIPFYGNAGGPDESMPIAAISMYSVVDDPDQGTIAYSFPPSYKITISGAAVPVEATTWGQVKSAWID